MRKIEFLLIFLFTFVIYSKIQIPKKVWVYWANSIQNAPLFPRLCYERIKIVCKQEKWELTVLTDQNLKNYVKDYAEFEQILRKRKMGSTQAKSDFVRLTIIRDQGGVYFDASSILVYGLKWLEQIDQNPHLITNQGHSITPDLIAFYVSIYQGRGQYRNQKNGLTHFTPGYQAWFIAGKQNSPAIQGWRKSFIKFYTMEEKQHLKVYQQEDIFFSNFDHNFYLTVDKAAQYHIQKVQKQLDKNISLFFKRKNANQQLNFWGLNGQVGPLSLALRTVPNAQLTYLKTLQQLKQQYFQVKYYFKVTGGQAFYLVRQLQDQRDFFQRHQTFDKFMKQNPSQDDCRRLKFIVQGSALGILIDKNPFAEQQKIYSITLQQRNQWLTYCKKFQRQVNRQGLEELYWHYTYKFWEWFDKTRFSLLTRYERLAEIELYQKDLNLFQKLLVRIKANQVEFAVYLTCIYVTLAFFIGIGLIMLFAKSVLETKFPNVLNNFSQTKCNWKNCLIKIGYCLFLALCMKQYYHTYRLVDHNRRVLLLIMLIASQFIKKQFIKRFDMKKYFVFKLSNEEFFMIASTLLNYFLGKTLLSYIQHRKQDIVPHSIIICLVCPHLIRMIKRLNISEKELKQNNNQQDFSLILKFIIQKLKLNKIFILGFATIIILFPNIRFIVYDDKYIIRNLVWFPLLYTGVLYIVLVVNFLKIIKNKSKQLFIKQNRTKQNVIDLFSSSLLSSLFQFAFLTLVIQKAMHLHETYWDWITPPHKSMLDMKFILIFMTLSIKSLSCFQKFKVSLKFTIISFLIQNVVFFFMLKTQLYFQDRPQCQTMWTYDSRPYLDTYYKMRHYVTVLIIFIIWANYKLLKKLQAQNQDPYFQRPQIAIRDQQIYQSQNQFQSLTNRSLQLPSKQQISILNNQNIKN